MKRDSQSMKKVYFEALRIIAVLFVIYNHTETTGFQYYTITDNLFLYYISLICAIICKTAVPIFFMISGALLLNKDEKICKVYFNRIFRIVIVLLIFSLFVYIINLKDAGSFDLSIFLKTVYSSQVRFSYWYLYAYISFLIALPLLRKMVKAMEKKDFVYLLLLGILAYYIIPVMQYILGIGRNSYLEFAFAGQIFLFYPLIGYYCDKYLSINKKNLLFLLTASLLSIVLTIIMTNAWIDQTGNIMSQNWLNAFILIPSITVFAVIKLIFAKMTICERISKIICTIGSCTFGIYLLEGPIRQFCYMPIFNALFPYVRAFPACIITVIIVFFICFVLVLILKKLPGFKTLL